MDKTSGVTFEEFENVIEEVQCAQGSLFIDDYILWLSWCDIGAKKKIVAATHSRVEDLMSALSNEHQVERRQKGALHVDRDFLMCFLANRRWKVKIPSPNKLSKL